MNINRLAYKHYRGRENTQCKSDSVKKGFLNGIIPF